MNSLQLTLTEKDVRALLDDVDLKIATSKFKGKGIPEVVVITVVKTPDTMNLFKHRVECGEKRPV